MAEAEAGSALLRETALLLLRRERELFAMRQGRSRATAWLDAVLTLSRTSTSEAEVGANCACWTALAVRDLHFQVAGCFVLEPGSSMLRTIAWQAPSGRVADALAVSAELGELLAARGSGFADPASPEPRARALGALFGLERFHWFVATPRAEARIPVLAPQTALREDRILLVAGFARVAGSAPAVDEEDLRYFPLLGQHMEALLRNALLLADLRKRGQDLEVRGDRALAELRKLSQAVEHGPAGVIMTEFPGIVSYVNPAFCKYSGYSPEEVVGRPASELSQGLNSPGVMVEMVEALLQGRVWKGTIRNRRKDGTLYWTRTAIAPVPGDGDRFGTVGVEEDVTQLREQEQRLIEARREAEEASKAKSAFLANMSHELRTPLNGIIGFSELLEQEHFGPLNAKQRSYVQNVLASGRHLLQLVNDVLDISKVEAERLTISREWLHIATSVDSVRGIVQPLADRAGVRLELELPAELPPLQADPLRVKQILYNLLSNGVKFTPRGGRVRLHAAAADGCIAITVEDNGIGIREADLPRLFREFEQIEQASGAKAEGTGLGLALTKKLVEMLGGSISVKSEVGRGSSFTVRWPLEPDGG